MKPNTEDDTRNINLVVGKALAKLRAERNLRQEDVEEGVPLGKTSLSKYEKGTRVFDLDTLQSLAKFFEVSYFYFLEEDADEYLHNLKNAAVANLIADLPQPKRDAFISLLLCEWEEKHGSLGEHDSVEARLLSYESLLLKRHKENK